MNRRNYYCFMQQQKSVSVVQAAISIYRREKLYSLLSDNFSKYFPSLSLSKIIAIKKTDFF